MLGFEHTINIACRIILYRIIAHIELVKAMFHETMQLTCAQLLSLFYGYQYSAAFLVLISIARKQQQYYLQRSKRIQIFYFALTLRSFSDPL